MLSAFAGGAVPCSQAGEEERAREREGTLGTALIPFVFHISSELSVTDTHPRPLPENNPRERQEDSDG